MNERYESDIQGDVHRSQNGKTHSMRNGTDIHNTEVVAQNDSLYLRKMNEDDATFILSLTNEPGWLLQIGDKNIHSIEQAKEFIRTGPMQTYQKYGFGLYVVVHKQLNQAVGVCGLLKRPYLDAPDLGYAISEAFYRKGYAFMSCDLVLGMVEQLTPASSIYASTIHTNVASQNLLKKLGFHIDGALISEHAVAENLVLYKKKIRSK